MRRSERGPLLERITAVGAGLMLLATIVLALGGHQYSKVAKALAWTIPAQPCPVISQQAYAAFGARASDRFDFDGTRFARAYGYAKCGEIFDDPAPGQGRIPVCQFNNPTVVEVITQRGRTYFMTGMQPATITVAHSQPRCVLGARLGLDWLRE